MKTTRESRINIIKAIQTPLGFFVFVVLIVEAIFGIIASFSDVDHRTYLFVGMFAVIFFLVLIVSVIAVYRPEALYGSRPIAGGSLTKKTSEETIHGDGAKCILIEGSYNISAEMSNIAKEAVKYIYTIGGRSRDQIYLNSIESRVRTGDVHYIRVITGEHIRHTLCEHLIRIMYKADLGYLIEEKFGGVMVTHNVTIVALPSSNVSVLNKALRIESDQIAADYRSYIIEVLANSHKNITNEKIKLLCKSCGSNNTQPAGESDAE